MPITIPHIAGMTEATARDFLSRLAVIKKAALRVDCLHPDQDCHIYELGLHEYLRIRANRSFGQVVEEYLETKHNLLPKSLNDYRACLRNAMAAMPEKAEAPMYEWSEEICRRMLFLAYRSSASREKARRILHAFFRYAQESYLVRSNPMENISAASLLGEYVPVLLSRDELQRVLVAARESRNRSFAVAIGMMVWAGLRPVELERLSWGMISRRRGHMSVPQDEAGKLVADVAIPPVLEYWLAHLHPRCVPQKPLLVANWSRQWKKLRINAQMPHLRAEDILNTWLAYALPLQPHTLHEIESRRIYFPLERQDKILHEAAISSTLKDYFWNPKGLCSDCL